MDKNNKSLSKELWTDGGPNNLYISFMLFSFILNFSFFFQVNELRDDQYFASNCNLKLKEILV